MTKKIFIMGASTGIGKALAIHYAQENIILGLASRRIDLLEEVATVCKENKATVYIFKVDVNSEAECEKTAKEFIKVSNGIDIVIANSGIGSHDDILSGSSQQINRILSTNILGVTNTLIPFIPSMKDQENGSIVVISSVASFIPLRSRGGYSSSKIAVRRLFDSWRFNLQDYGINVITICPGFIETPMTEHIKSKPFLKNADTAAIAFAKAIERGEKTFIYPWQWRWLVLLTKLIPNSLLHWILNKNR